MDTKTFSMWMEQGNISIPNILLTNYKKLGITEQALVTLIHLYSFIDKGNLFPTPGEIAERMTITEQQCTDILRKCLQTGLIEIIEHKDAEYRHSEVYSLKPLWEKIVLFLEQQVKQDERKNQIDHQKDVYSILEREFGRPLSPIECETLTIWLDHDYHPPELIIAALKEAVLSGKMNFRYIDKILFEWNKNGIKTVEGARKYGEKFRRYQNQNKRKQEQPKTSSSSVDMPFYNWLD